MATAKEIKQRIKSINNTAKTTKAMELVSAAKMRRASEAAHKSREYRAIAHGILSRLRQSAFNEADAQVRRFFADAQEGGKTTLVVFSSNRGLCGAFNTNVIKTVAAYIEEHPQEEIDLVCIGKKGVRMLSSLGYNARLAYEKDDAAMDNASIRDIAATLYKEYQEGNTDRIAVIYSDYVSPMEQKPQVKALYPIADANKTETTDNAELAGVHAYEPSGIDVLSHIVPRIAEVELYQALLESNASEHAARMLAMKNATEAAKDMGKQLKLAYNRARQAAITKEIAEIAAGKAAVS